MGDQFFTKALLADERIISYQFVRTGAEPAELWFREIILLFEEWNRDQPLLLVLNLSALDSQLSAEMLRGVGEAERSKVLGRTAVVGGELTEKFTGAASNREWKRFDNQADAVAWLLMPLSSELPYNRVWIQNGQILHFSFRDADRVTAELWFQDMVTTFRTWNERRPLLILIDVRSQGMFISAQAMMRARQISHVTPDVPGRTAVLIGSPITAQIVSTLVRTGLAPGKRQRLVFGDEARAIAWLLEAAKPHP